MARERLKTVPVQKRYTKDPCRPRRASAKSPTRVFHSDLEFHPKGIVVRDHIGKTELAELAVG
jgi:hypothetical protein